MNYILLRMHKTGINKDSQLEAIRKKYGFDRKFSASSHHSQSDSFAKTIQANYENKTTKNQLNTAAALK
jgi:hypothetical protein